MERKTLDGGTLIFDSLDREAAEWAGAAAEEALRRVAEQWELRPRGDLQVHAMTSWAGFLFRAAPPLRRLWLLLSFPLWTGRVARVWKVAGGWTQRSGGRVAVGVKPPRLLAVADRSLGERIFLPEPDMEKKVRQIAGHETVHACTAHLTLPSWLNEGLAMVAVDHLAQKPTVRPETIARLAETDVPAHGHRHPAYSRRDPGKFLRRYIQGYWRVRFLEETKPGLLKKLLKGKRRSRAWLPAIACALGLDDAGGAELDRLVAEHFKGLTEQTTKRNA